MNEKISALAKFVQSANRKRLFRRDPVFKPYGAVSLDDVDALSRKIGMPMPDDLCSWLLAIGYGDIDEEISFREEWFFAIEHGKLKGGATFAQDVLGDFYAFDALGQIYYLSRSQSVFAIISGGFIEFIEELIWRDYKLVDWVGVLNVQPYEW